LPLPTIITLWVQGTLGPIEKLSLASSLAQGHRTVLYTYGAVVGAPAGVEIMDARDVLPEEAAMANRYPNGSFALFANLFRLQAQRQGLGVWCDTDIVFVRPLTISSPIILGRESDRYINNAVLYIDRDQPILADAIAHFGRNTVPPWIPFRRAPMAHLKRLIGRPTAPRDLPHGTFGPKAMTALVKAHGLEEFVQPEDVFYPVHPRAALSVFEPGGVADASITDRTITIHLWNEKLRDVRNTSPAPGSLLRQLYDRYGV